MSEAELMLKSGLPPYAAVMLCLPGDNDGVVNFPTPPLMETVFKTVVPSLNVTTPPGAPPYCPLITAVSVRDCPALEGLREEVSVAVVVALFTTCLTGVDVLAAKSGLWPEKTAVIECIPAGSSAVLRVATPPVSVTAPSLVIPSLKITVPDGVMPYLPATVDFKVTVCPKLDGLGEVESMVVD